VREIRKGKKWKHRIWWRSFIYSFGF